MVDLKKRNRKVNVENIPDEQLEELMVQLGDKLREIVDKAVNEANYLTEPYGFSVKMQFASEPLNKDK